MTLRTGIRGGAFAMAASLAALSDFLFPLQASAQDNSGLSSQVLLTQADLPSNYSPQGSLNTAAFPDTCTGGSALVASLATTSPGNQFIDESAYPVVNGIGSDVVVGDNVSETEAAFKTFGTKAFLDCAFTNAQPQTQSGLSNTSTSQLPDPGVGDQSSEYAFSYTLAASGGSLDGVSGDILTVRVGQILGEVQFTTVGDTAQPPGLQVPADLQTQLTALFVSRMRAAAAQIPGGLQSGAPATLHLAPYPLNEIVGRSFSGNVALVTFKLTSTPAPPLTSFSATIKWGDGTTSAGTLVKAPANINAVVGTDGIAFLVRGSHRYLNTLNSDYTVAVGGPSHTLASGGAPVAVNTLRPTAFFTANPINPVQDGIGLFVPAPPGPGQGAIASYTWHILDGDTVVDNSRTRPIYNLVLSQLGQDPGNSALRSTGIQYGILPSDANGGFLGAGGLTDDQVRQVVGVWQAYFPSHIVPHLFDAYGNVGVGLTVTDVQGHNSSEYTQNYSVSRDCQPWGGPLASWFGNLTVCDTYNGIAAQFGPHRPSDYISFGISNILAIPGGLLGLSGGLSLTIIPRLLLSDPAHAAFITPQLSAGVSSPGPNAGVTRGWVGPPGPANYPNDPETIYNFVEGADLYGGFAISGFGLGLGFTAVENPGNGLVGEENSYNLSYGAGLSLGAGETCSFSLGQLSKRAIKDLSGLYNTWNQQSANATPSQLNNQLSTVFGDMKAGGADPIGTAVSVLRIATRCLVTELF